MRSYSKTLSIQAALIIGVLPASKLLIDIGEDDPEEIQLNDAWFVNNQPCKGDYLVKSDEGYTTMTEAQLNAEWDEVEEADPEGDDSTDDTPPGDTTPPSTVPAPPSGSSGPKPTPAGT